MALGTNFKGARLNKKDINSKKYALLACNTSVYTRGELIANGSTLYLMGIVGESEYKREPDKVLPVGVNDAVFSRKASFNATVYATVKEKALQELEESKITLFVVDANSLIGLDGFTYTTADFTNINGILNADYIFNNVIPEIEYSAKGGEVTQFSLNVNIGNKQDLSTQVFQDEPVGTFIAYWDWTGSSSLVDSVNSITLSTTGSPTYSTDHYEIDGTASDGLLVNNFAETSPLNIGRSNVICYFFDWLDNSTGTRETAFTIGDGDTTEIRLETRASQAGIGVNWDSAIVPDTFIAFYNYTATARKAIMLYINIDKNIIKFIGSTGELKRYIPFASNQTPPLGGFTGSDNDLYVGLTQSGANGANIHVYKLGISH